MTELWWDPYGTTKSVRGIDLSSSFKQLHCRNLTKILLSESHHNQDIYSFMRGRNSFSIVRLGKYLLLLIQTTTGAIYDGIC